MKKLILNFLLIFPLFVNAQSYIINKLGIKEGLSNNHVVSIAQDKRGFMWFSTEEGLNMFDGINFRSYYKEEGKVIALTGNELNGLLDDPKDSILWIATQRAGINAYDYGKNKFLVFKNQANDKSSLITNDVTKITAAANGNLWVCTYWKGIDYFNKHTQKFTHYNTSTVPSMPSNNVWTALDGHDGNLYIGHVHNGFSVLNIKSRKVTNFRHQLGKPSSLPDDEVTCIYKDLLNNIWVGTSKGLALYNPQEGTFLKIDDNSQNLSHRIYSIQQTKDNKLWVAMELGGIAIIDLSRHMFQSINSSEFTFLREGDDDYGLSGNSIRSLYQDSFGNIWIGGWGCGINFIGREVPLFNNYKYSPYLYFNSLTNKTASSLCFDTKGQLWIGTDGDGINLFKNGKRIREFSTANAGSNGNTIQASLCDSKGGLWFGLFSGGIRYCGKQSQQFERVPLQPNDAYHTDIRHFYEDRQGVIWVGTSEGIYLIDRDSKKVLHHYSLGNNLVRAIHKDTKGQVWVGFFGDGVSVYNSKMQRVRYYNVGNRFPSNTVNTIYEDSHKQIWIGTAEGLVKFDNCTALNYRTYNRDHKLVNTHIFAIAEDKENNIWVSTNRGISCLPKGCETFFNYDHRDNVPLGSFCRESIAKDQEGNLYFGSINGVCFFNPKAVLKERQSPRVFINTLEITGSINDESSTQSEISIAGRKKIRLKHKQNSFTITFNIQNYALSNRIEYAYRLEGLSDSWFNVKDLNSITFRKLPPGNYRLSIKSRIHNQQWSNDITTLDIRISPPIWLTFGAKFIYALLIIGFILYLAKQYKHQLEVEALYKLEKRTREHEHELNDERLRFYTNITHELRTPLTLILGPLEDLAHNKSFAAKDAQTIGVIHKSALRLLNLINQLLEFRKVETQNRDLCVEKDNIVTQIKEIGQKYISLNVKPHVEIRLDIEDENISIYYDHEIVQIILDNLISNALKYTDKGSVTIGIRAVELDGKLHTQLYVSDTGTGINADTLPHIFERYYQGSNSKLVSGTGIGLSLVKKLVELHEGKIDIESTPKKGSTFRVNLPTDEIYTNALHADSKEKEEALAEHFTEEEIENANEKAIVLIVEDNKDIADYIADSLQDRYETHKAYNGQQGKEEALKIIPDIIVSDIMMPVMDGNQMCHALKKDVRTSHVPIILLTAKDSIHDKEEGYMMGADSYLTKPFSSSLLKSRIENLLESRNKLAHYYQNHSTTIQEEKSELIATSLCKLDSEFLQKLNGLIEEGLSSEKVDITYLADNMFMSSSTLYRKTKALTGLSTNEYVRKIKMKHAEQMLLEGRYNISEIALHVGFNNMFYFRQCFKDEFGTTPTDYLKKIKG